MYITGADLRRMRLRSGKPIEELAKAVGVKSKKTITAWEENQSQPNYNQFLYLALACGFDAAKLIKLFLDRASLEIEADLSQAQ